MQSQEPSKPDYSAAAQGAHRKRQGSEQEKPKPTSPQPSLKLQLPAVAKAARIEQADPVLLRQIRLCKYWPLYLWGATGRGKTCAAAIAYALWRPTAFWSSLTELCDTLKVYNFNQTQMVQTRSGSIELTHSGFWKKLTTSDLVVIDEIGTRDATAHRYDALLRLLDARIGRPLILTSNLDPSSPSGLGTVYDARILSRIMSGTLLEVRGHDRRGDGLHDRIKHAPGV